MGFATTTFTVRQLLRQLKDDLWCKEVATGYTVSYTWEANQLGHFAIGFAPTAILASVLAAFIGLSPWLALFALAPIAFMWLKEGGDVRTEQERFRTDPGIEALNLADIQADARTALLFSGVGAVVGAAPYYASLFPRGLAAIVPVLALALGFIPCAVAMRYWISKKMCFQQAALPFTYRLSYFPVRKIRGDLAAAQAAIARFQSAQLGHLVIAGGANCGKTSLATALGTEIAFRQAKVRYMELVDFLEVSRAGSELPVHLACVRWWWADAEVLILDDVGPGPLMGQALRLLEPAYAEVLARMRTRKIIWSVESGEGAEPFIAILRQVFGEDAGIAGIDLA